MPCRLAILVSGRGSNMLSVLDAIESEDLPAEAVLVLSDNPDAGGLDAARERHVPVAVCEPAGYSSREEWSHAVTGALDEAGANLVALAGFMRVMPASFCTRWLGQLVNIHPSLLPRHKGLDTHQRALDAGDPEAGCSVHFVTAELDGGPVIAQSRVQVLPTDSASSLAARVLEKEHVIYPQVLTWCASRRVALRGGAVEFDSRKLHTPIEV